MIPSPRTAHSRALLHFLSCVSAGVIATAVIAPASAQDAAAAAGSSALSGSTGNGSAHLPGSSTLQPSDPYSDDTDHNLVAFGDSFTANSHSVANNIASSTEGYPEQDGCLVAPDAWPGLLAGRSDIPVQNRACTNSGTAHMLNRVTRAVDAGAVNDTSTVVLSSGMNDKRRGLTDDEITGNLTAAIRTVQDAAPGAEVIILGRLASTNQAGRLCSVNVIPYAPLGVVNEATAAAEDATQRNQRAAAERTGVEFIDVRSATQEKHSTCARDDERYVSGTLDVTTPQFNMPSHPSRAGSGYLADAVGEHIGA